MIRISRSFIKGSLIYTAIGTLPMASAILLVPFYMANLSTADFGALSIYLAFSLLVQLVVTYSFDTSLYIHYHEFKSDKTKLSSFVSSAFVLMLLIGIGLSIIILPTGSSILAIIFVHQDIAFFPYGWLAIGGGIFQALFKVHSNLLQSREKPETFFWSNLALFTAIVIFTITGLNIFPQSLLGPLGGRLLALGLASIWVLFRIFREFGFHFDTKLLGSSFSFNFYSFIYQLQQWVINYFDRILMVFYLPLASVGVYDFAIKCLIGIELFMNGLHGSFYPMVVKEVMGQEIKGSSIRINRYYNGFVAVIMVVVSASIFILPFLIEWLSDYVNKPDYKNSIEYIPYIAVIYLFRTVRLQFAYPYSILKYSKPMPVIYLVAVLVKIGGMVLLIESLEIYGVIIASIFSQLVEMLLLTRGLKSKFDLKYSFSKIIAAPLLIFMLIILLETTWGGPNAVGVHMIYLVACVVILMLIYRNELKLIKFSDIR